MIPANGRSPGPRERDTMKIVDIRLTGLSGGTVDGGWPEGNPPEEDLNTLLEIITDEGLTGVGSVFTSKALTPGAVERLRPMLIGERADEPARVTEKLRQSTFWQGRGGAVEHAISGRDIALWDVFGKACGHPVSRLLGGRYRDRIKPYGSILFEEPPLLRERLLQTVARGFRAIKLGWRPFGRRDRKYDELLVRTAREAVGPGVELMVDAGGSEQFWPHGYKWGLAADLHLTAAVPVARYVEYLTPCVYLDELVTEPFRPDAEGYLCVPDKPGLGIELNREALKRFGV